MLVVGAHPDDIDFGAAGSVALWVAAGAEVAYAVVTDGDAGGLDPAIDRHELARIRREEQLAAAAAVGVHEVHFLGYPDGRLVADLALRRDLARLVRRVRPERVVCPSPERDYTRLRVSHPDHLAVGEATLAAVYPDARNPFAFPELLEEGLEPHAVRELWIVGGPHANRAVDVTGTIERKIAAILAHRSQHADPSGTAARVRAFTAESAAAAGLGEGRFAERFLVASI